MADEVEDRTKAVNCSRCETPRDAVILPGLLVCHACDVQVIQQATVSVPGPIKRDHACSNCANRQE